MFNGQSKWHSIFCEMNARPYIIRMLIRWLKQGSRFSFKYTNINILRNHRFRFNSNVWTCLTRLNLERTTHIFSNQLQQNVYFLKIIKHLWYENICEKYKQTQLTFQFVRDKPLALIWIELYETFLGLSVIQKGNALNWTNAAVCCSAAWHLTLAWHLIE